MLLNRNLPAAQPLAVIERFFAGIFRTDSILITDYIAGSTDLETFLTRDVASQAPSIQRRLKNCLIDDLVILIRHFHACGFVHRDFKAPNLLVNWDPPFQERPRFTFIDMDGIGHVRRATDRQRWKAIVRLGISLLSSPACTRTDRLRFLRRYLLGAGQASKQWKDRWRLLDEQVDRKVRSKSIRRQWKLKHYGRE